MSEGTPGRGPDADSRTDTGDGQAATDGRPVVPPVRYGPRNGSPSNGANGRGGSNGRPVSAPSSPQQYRAPRSPADPTPPKATPPVPGSNGSESNGSGTNGSGTNGAHAATPSSYTRPRTNGTATRPEQGEQDRRVADARIAAAARNASAAKVRGGSALGGTRAPAAAEEKAATPDASAPVDETAVIPAVVADETAVVTPSEATDADATTTSEATATVSAKPRGGMFGRLRSRDRRPAADSATPVVTPETGAETPTAETPTAETPTAASPTADASTTTEVKPAEPSDATPESAAAATAADTATTERPLTWRDRLGLPPKAKAQPDTAPDTDAASTGSTDGAGAAAAGGTTQVAPGQDRVSPSPFAPGGSSDTVVIPAIDVAATGAPVPVAGATALPVVAAAPAPAPKAKVGAARRTRKARLRLSRVDPWSVMKTALLFSIAAGIILVVATYGVWSVLNASGLFDAVNDMVKSVVSTPGDTTPFRIEEYVNTQKIIGVAALIAVVDVLIFTALATLGSFLYNLAATVLGGLEVTLAED